MSAGGCLGVLLFPLLAGFLLLALGNLPDAAWVVFVSILLAAPVLYALFAVVHLPPSSVHP